MWVARWLRAVKGKLAALIAPLTLRDPGQPFATVLTGLYDLLLRSPSCLDSCCDLIAFVPRLSRHPWLAQPLPTLLGDEPDSPR